MTNISDIYDGAQRLIHQLIREEMVNQGHHLTGAMEASVHADIQTKGKRDIMDGYAVNYTQFVNDGFPAQSASFRQFPFLLEYFIKRGYPVHSSNGGLTAGSLAAMTIRKWMREGMPTQASKSYSSTGSRTNMIEAAFVGGDQKIDEYMGNSFDFVVEEKFQKEKSETI